MKIKQPFQKDKLFFTSDNHFYHDNIIKFCNRPFANAKEMNAVMIERWNAIVPPDGIVFNGGDFALTGNIGSVRNIVEQLNGLMYFTYGNHDYQNRFDRDVIKEMFYQCDDMYHISVENDAVPGGLQNILITHYPFLYWRRGSIHLHGHVHGGPGSTASEQVPYHFMRYDIGVDNNNYAPISYLDLAERMKQAY
jgi:calcineurin-like phosphoesterase family protein